MLTDKKSLTGNILSIERSALHDGPGIRTAVFLKGCPLSCRWCHNPESWKAASQLAFFREKCIGCGNCVHNCRHQAHRLVGGRHLFDRTLCQTCGICADRCPADALKLYGQELTVSQVMETVVKDTAYYTASGGGLTITGGEPFAQPGFTLALLKQAKKAALHTCVETSGYVNPDVIEQAAALVDCFLFDYKLTSSSLHLKFTGVDNRLIMDNLNRLYTLGKTIILRCPIIPGINDTEEHFMGIADLESQYPQLAGVQIMPYHNMGKDKGHSIGASGLFETATTTPEMKQQWKKQMKLCGCSKTAIESFH